MLERITLPLKRRITTIFSLALLCSPLAAAALTYPVSATLFEPMPFTSHQGGQYAYWLADTINPAAIADLKQQVEASLNNAPLLDRGEAHITVITPPEYNVLKPHLNADSIDNIALQHGIQQAKFMPLCLGRARITKNGMVLSSYFIVVKSPQLLEIRQAIFEEYVKHGGEPSQFDPDHYTPHITIGFTQRDLFESDGIYKQHNACIADLKID